MIYMLYTLHPLLVNLFKNIKKMDFDNLIIIYLAIYIV